MTPTPAATVPPVTLDKRRARDLARLAQKLDATRAERDSAIRDAYAAGATLREIGDAVGLSFAGVKKILDRHAKKPPAG